MSESHDEASRKIQKLIKKTISKRKLEADLHWKIFSDLDTIMENEMLQLAAFMKVLMEKIPERMISMERGNRRAYSTDVSGQSGNDSSSNSAPQHELHVFEVFENERRAVFPPHAFGPGNLFIHPHYSDFSGKLKIDVVNDDLNTIKPLYGCEWAGDWKICRQHTQTDANGWSYAVSYDFLVSNCRNNKSIARSMGRASRRRRHIRVYRRLPEFQNTLTNGGATASSSASSSTAASSQPTKRTSLYPQFTSPIAVDDVSVDVHRPSHLSPSGAPSLPVFSGDLLPGQKADLAYAAEVIALISSGRRLSSEAFTRLIEDCTTLLKELPNIVNQQVPSSASVVESDSAVSTAPAVTTGEAKASSGEHHSHHAPKEHFCKARIIVVGDIHGSLSDLLHILERFGLPSEHNRFVFNGDFVDRGDMGVEIMTILMVLYLAAPSYVVLNRGNHEDRTINGVYGFQEECTTKYDVDVFEKIAVLFDCLPLFVIIGEAIFVVHGGLFLDRTVSLDDLSRINRFDYECQAEIPYPQCLEFMTTAEEQWDAFGKELMRNALWSDPRPEPGMELSHRGSGVVFGPDVAKEFMTNNNFKMVIRSHEVCKKGFYLPFGKITNPSLYNPSLPLLCTIFSASNYSNSGNEAAVLVISDAPHFNTHPIEGTPYHFVIDRYSTSSPEGSLVNSNKSSLSEIIRKKRTTLIAEFHALDPRETGWVTRTQWADTMNKVTSLRIRWLAVIGSMVHESALTSTQVQYTKFLEQYSINSIVAAGGAGAKLDMDSLYAQRKRLEVMFSYFDANGDGVITHEEFQAGCALLNEHLPEGQKLTDTQKILGILDFDGSGEIDLNEFFEAFRILESRAML